MQETIEAAGGGVGVFALICIIIKAGPAFVVTLFAAVTAFQKDPTVHNRLRRLLRDLNGSSATDRKKKGHGGLTGVRLKK